MEKFLQERKKNVDDFIKSFLLHKKLEEVSDCDEEGNLSTTVKPVAKNPYDEQLEEGQIRLLAHTERITYVSLLKRWNTNAFVVMPFSRYNSPATDEEFKTDFDGGLYLRVLQAWNTRTLQDKTLKQSWLIGYLSKEDFEAAWKMWESTLGDVTLTDDLLKKTGLPIYRKIDPRVEYKREELDNFARIDAEDLAAMTDNSWSFDVFNREEETVALAAGDERKNIQLVIHAKAPQVSVFVEFSHDDKLTLDVYDADSELSNALDGCMVLNTANGTFLGVLQDGHLELTFDDSVCSIAIIDKNGQPLREEIESGDENG